MPPPRRRRKRTPASEGSLIPTISSVEARLPPPTHPQTVQRCHHQKPLYPATHAAATTAAAVVAVVSTPPAGLRGREEPLPEPPGHPLLLSVSYAGSSRRAVLR